MTIELNMFTPTEIALAADRFLISEMEHGWRIRLADDFMAPEQHLSRVDDCLKLVETALERGHKVNIKVSNESSRISSRPSP